MLYNYIEIYIQHNLSLITWENATQSYESDHM